MTRGHKRSHEVSRPKDTSGQDRSERQGSEPRARTARIGGLLSAEHTGRAAGTRVRVPRTSQDAAVPRHPARIEESVLSVRMR